MTKNSSVDEAMVQGGISAGGGRRCACLVTSCMQQIRQQFRFPFWELYCKREVALTARAQSTTVRFLSMFFFHACACLFVDVQGGGWSS